MYVKITMASFCNDLLRSIRCVWVVIACNLIYVNTFVLWLRKKDVIWYTFSECRAAGYIWRSITITLSFNEFHFWCRIRSRTAWSIQTCGMTRCVVDFPQHAGCWKWGCRGVAIQYRVNHKHCTSNRILLKLLGKFWLTGSTGLKISSLALN